MPKCSAFTVKVKGDMQKVLDEVTKLAKKKGAEVKGDVTKGTIKIPDYKISGTYAVKGQEITLAMEEDHWMVTCDRVKEEISAFFKGK